MVHCISGTCTGRHETRVRGMVHSTACCMAWHRVRGMVHASWQGALHKRRLRRADGHEDRGHGTVRGMVHGVVRGVVHGMVRGVVHRAGHRAPPTCAAPMTLTLTLTLPLTLTHQRRADGHEELEAGLAGA